MEQINQSLASMALMPPHCPMHPKTYASFYNDSASLGGSRGSGGSRSLGIAPYKLKTEKHPRDGHPVSRLEYNNFYSDWKTDALKWYPASSIINAAEFESSQNSRNILPGGEAMELYEQTRRHDAFAVPLPTNGTNQIRILFNDSCNVPTFQYKRYAAQPVNNSSWFYNKLYLEDITEETREQKAAYMNSIVQNSMDIYSSVFEDMSIMDMETGDSNGDNLDFMRKTY